MTHSAAAALTAPARARTGGTGDEDGRFTEQVLGWVLAVLVAVLAARLGLV
ncbi:hypothetical protein N566_10095 [Streptomycetaceae bacterium MP113-05]|nr:hypothetical protein N566_10095 [Streptomycetaceae bacterium MP113-05]